MSYILDALKKADQERTLGEVPDLETPHWGERRTQPSYRWFWIVVALLLFNAVLLAVYLWRGDGEDETVLDTQRPDEPVASQAAPMPVTPLPRTDRKLVESPRVATRPKVLPPVTPPVSQPAQPPVTTPAQPAVSPPASPPEKSPAPPATAVSVPSRSSNVPEWGELSLDFRSGFPVPHLDVHVYAEEPGRRFILVNLKKYREGDTLESGAVLEEIQPGSIQLNYQGTRFRLDK